LVALPEALTRNHHATGRDAKASLWIFILTHYPLRWVFYVGVIMAAVMVAAAHC